MSEDDARDRVLVALTKGARPEDVFVVEGGRWIHAQDLSDPVLRFLCLRSIRELQREITPSGVSRA